MSSTQRLKGILSVTVLKANGLKKSDLIGENDCFTIVSLEPLTNKGKVDVSDRREQSEIYQKTQIHDGCNPIFNEKLLFPISDDLQTLYVQIWDSDIGKDDLLGHGTVNLIDDQNGGQFDTNTDKQWLHVVDINLESSKGKPAGTMQLVLHFIPETVAKYLSRRFDAHQAELKKKLSQKVVSKMSDVVLDQF